MTIRTPYAEHLFLLLCVVAVIAFYIWANIGLLDVVSNATGEVIPVTKVKKVQHLEGGIINEILVKEGDTVTTGEALVVLEAVQSGAEVDELKIRLHALKIKVSRLRAEVNQEKTMTVDKNLQQVNSTLEQQEISLFFDRQQRLESQIKVQKQLVIQHQYEIEQIKSRIRSNKRVKKFLDEQITISKNLLAQSLSNRMTHLNLLKEATEIEGALAEDKANLKRIQSSINEAKNRMQLVTNTFLEKSREDLHAALQDLDILKQRLKKTEDSLRRTVLRSPVSGVIKSLYVSSTGGVLAPGETVAEIVPGEDKLIIEAKLPVADIGYVRIGNTAHVRLATADGFRFNFIQGTVTHISPDTLVNKEGIPFYQIHIDIQGQFFKKRDEVHYLFPGMMVQCSILIGKRSIFEYLLEPFIGSFSSALQER